jgi:hypothetical protein
VDVGIPESTAIGMLIIVIAMVIGVFLGAYLIGSIPFGYLVGRLFFHTDIRRQGSGNTGAMNALRALGMRGAALVLLLDALKGFVPTLWALNVFNGFLDTPGLPPGGRDHRRRSSQPARYWATAFRHGCDSAAGRASRPPLEPSLRSVGPRDWLRPAVGWPVPQSLAIRRSVPCWEASWRP